MFGVITYIINDTRSGAFEDNPVGWIPQPSCMQECALVVCMMCYVRTDCNRVYRSYEKQL